MPSHPWDGVDFDEAFANLPLSADLTGDEIDVGEKAYVAALDRDLDQWFDSDKFAEVVRVSHRVPGAAACNIAANIVVNRDRHSARDYDTAFTIVARAVRAGLLHDFTIDLFLQAIDDGHPPGVDELRILRALIRGRWAAQGSIRIAQNIRRLAVTALAGSYPGEAAEMLAVLDEAAGPSAVVIPGLVPGLVRAAFSIGEYEGRSNVLRAMAPFAPQMRAVLDAHRAALLADARAGSVHAADLLRLAGVAP